MAKKKSGEPEQLTELQKRFCEIHTTVPSAGKAWNMARFSLGMTETESADVARIAACKAKAKPHVHEYLEACRRIVSSVFPNGLPEPEKPQTAEPKPSPNLKYKPEYCDAIRKYFNVPHFKDIETVVVRKNGDTITRQELKPVPPPHPGAFARSIGVSTRAITEWRKKYPEFSDAYDDAIEMRGEHLIDGGLVGTFNGHYCKLVTTNWTDLRDKTAVDVTSEGRAMAPTVTVVLSKNTDVPPEGGGS